MSTDELAPVVLRPDRRGPWPQVSSAAAVVLIAVGFSMAASSGATLIDRGPADPRDVRPDPTLVLPGGPQWPGTHGEADVDRVLSSALDLDGDGTRETVSLTYRESGGRARAGFTVTVALDTGPATAPGPGGWPPTLMPRLSLPGLDQAVLGVRQAGEGSDNPSFYAVDGSRLERLYTLDTAPLRGGVESTAEGWQVLGYDVFGGKLYSWRLDEAADGSPLGPAQSWTWQVRDDKLVSAPADCRVTVEAATC